MTVYKYGEALTISASDIRDTESVLSNPEIEERFLKFAKELKTIAPKAKDFLYFSAIMMHAAEASLLDDKGEIRKNADGSPVTAYWEKISLPNGKESVKWVCSDPTIKYYKNKNGDAFPENQLLAAYKNWIGKPLCLDHKSGSTNDTVGIIVDTYYDYKAKNIVALCALDKVNYPEMARKVSSGYATCVSMGVGCGRAVCSEQGCHNVATIEAEFCPHMKNKTCYAEINLDLNPIELSIVVNGADPKAKIRQIVAAANSIAKYVDQKDSMQVSANSEDLMTKLNRLGQEIEEIKKQASSENLNKQDLDISSEDSVVSFLGKLAHNVEDLTKKVNGIIKEKEMANRKEGFYQGTEEPSPKQVKYPVDPLQDQLREKEDRQMQGAPPFPGTGPVDGMHPGYQSFGESEEARKRRLQRLAEENDRKIRREAVLAKAKENLLKKSYVNGTEEPTPGKPKYPVDPLQDQLREKEDRQMVGQPPFPGVGAVDGLHPSPASADIKDEAKRKEMLQRASLKAKFFKGGTASTTRWEIYSGDKLVLNATLQDVAGDKADFHYDEFASKNFAQNLMKKIKAEGAESVANKLQKKAQAPVAAPPVQSPPPPMDAGMAPDGMNPGPSDEGGTGDPAQEVPAVIDEIENKLGDLRKGVEALTGGKDDLKGFQDLTDSGALPPAEGVQAMAMEKKLNGYLINGMKETYAKLKDLKADLEKLVEIRNFAKQRGELSKHASDIRNTVKESLIDANNLFGDTTTLKQAFVNYARTRSYLIKKAEFISMKQLTRKAQSKADVAYDPSKPVEGRIYSAGDPFMPADATPGVPYHASAGSTAQVPAKSVAKPTTVRNPPKAELGKEQVDPKLPAPYGDRSGLEKMLESGAGAIRGQDFSGKAKQTGTPTAQKGQVVSSTVGVPDAAKADDGKEEDENDLKMTPDGSVEGTPEEVGKAMKESKALDLSTKEKRAEARAKFAEKAMQFSEMLSRDPAHKGGWTLPTDTKPSGDLAKVETLAEQHQKMLDVATAPPKVKKAAEQIQKLVVEGKLDPKELPALISQGGLDPEAVKYWKTYLSQVKDGGSAYAADLVKDYSNKKKAESEEAYRVKMARAYEVVEEAVEKGIVSSDKKTKNAQFKSLLEYSDENFKHFADFVAKAPLVKRAAALPSIGASDYFGGPALPQTSEGENPYAAAFAGRKY